MMRDALRWLLPVALSLTLAHDGAAQMRAASEEITTPHLDFFGGAQTVESLVQRSDAVVVADVLHVGMAIRQTPLNPRTVVSEYTLNIAESFKDDGHLVATGEKLTVIVVGGHFRNGQFTSDSRTVTPPMRTGERALLCLQWWPAGKTYILKQNGSGAFRLSGTTVSTYMQSPIIESFGSSDVSAFLGAVRAAARVDVKRR